MYVKCTSKRVSTSAHNARPKGPVDEDGRLIRPWSLTHPLVLYNSRCGSCSLYELRSKRALLCSRMEGFPCIFWKHYDGNCRRSHLCRRLRSDVGGRTSASLPHLFRQTTVLTLRHRLTLVVLKNHLLHRISTALAASCGRFCNRHVA